MEEEQIVIIKAIRVLQFFMHWIRKQLIDYLKETNTMISQVLGPFFPNVTQILGNRSRKLLRITAWPGTWNYGTQITILLLTFTTPAGKILGLF